VNPFVVFSAFAAGWVIGFVVVPIPAGVGIREAVLVALLPGVGTAPLLAASLALRLLSIGTKLLSIAGNRLVSRRFAGLPTPETDPEPSSPELA
jgi:glycosyltransferase 2 family protein